jgi:hypothetical protein
MAEAESFKGKQTYSLTSSASGIFHFYRQRRRHNKARKRDLGQYDAKGVLRTSSLKQQRKDYAMMGNPSDSIKETARLSVSFTVLQARTPDDLSPQKQAILAYANLKMQSNDFSSYLQGNKLLQTCMARFNPR